MTGSALIARAQEWWLTRWMTAAKIRSDRKSLSEHRSATLRPRKVFVDVSVISRHDAGTGIQRVVRSISKELLARSNESVEIIPVSATRKRRYAPVGWPVKGAVVAKEINEMRVSPGDIFFGLDFSLDSLWSHRRQLTTLGKQGMDFWYVMYDLLPHRHPQWFSDALVARYRKWLYVTASTAKGYFCISPAVANDLREWLMGECRVPSCHMPQIEVMPMGWELELWPHSTGVRAETKTIVETAAQEPMILMVGTIEPRKGHIDVVSAFNQLWHEGAKLNLVIAGRPGWKTGELQKLLKQHPMSGKRLFWLQDATDEEIASLYRACFGVICASHAEGFGLPVIEALGYGKPVLARDIEAFHTFSTPAVHYFPAAATVPELARSIKQWIRDPCPLDPHAYRPSSWRDAALFIMTKLIEGNLDGYNELRSEL